MTTLRTVRSFLAAGLSLGVFMSSMSSVAATPKGVILVVLDDIGYGEIDCLYPSDLETPNFDKLWAQSVRLTDFHVGTSCSPSRASILTGRHLNVTGVWGTTKCRDVLRDNEQTMAEVFKANGWRTGIFGKWHLGEGYPYSPRFRGFEVSIIHGGGGVSQQADHWNNDYYSDVDFKGKPAVPDVYLSNGEHIQGEGHVTDFWFKHAKEFVRANVKKGKPFFCYLPTNAPHFPMHAPHGYKKGYDGLIEHLDYHMGMLDEFLVAEGIKDDVLLIFTSDNGTESGPKRWGGLRHKKCGWYDGAHNVPCFVRWKNGGLGGAEETARDVPYLTAGMDLLPTFMDLFDLERPEGGQPIHGTSLKPMLLDPEFEPQNRTVVVDTQRGRDLVKWKQTNTMKDVIVDGKIAHKWRLTRKSAGDPLELFDFNVDRGTKNDIVGAHPEVAKSLEAEYESWWEEFIAPMSDEFSTFVIDEAYEKESTLYCNYWIGGGPWSQGGVRNGFGGGTHTHKLRFAKPGLYRFELRRWPREDGGAIAGEPELGKGKALPIKGALLELEGIGEESQSVSRRDVETVFEMNVPAGETNLKAAFTGQGDKSVCGAYYVYVKRFGGK